MGCIIFWQNNKGFKSHVVFHPSFGCVENPWLHGICQLVANYLHVALNLVLQIQSIFPTKL
jgi:hypothetical protein